MRFAEQLWDSGCVITLWLLVAVLAVLAGVLAFALVRARHAHTRALEERGWLLERERETAARSAVDAERARIAHDLHDIVSHNVSVMVIQTGAARQVLATSPGDAEAALLAVEAAGRDTMAELRNLLGLLAPKASGEDDEALSPQVIGGEVLRARSDGVSAWLQRTGARRRGTPRSGSRA